ncbi:MAG TPA: hypothetical protein VD794_05585 [Flavisolibacter sp.]|nr:hypothetical protein [Flavisolibacter sp.]
MTNVFQAPEGPKTVKADSVVKKSIGLLDDEMLVDLNKVVQESLNCVKPQLEELKAIIRCDGLPHILANATDVRKLSDNLIRFILQHPPRKSKLFIYIKCNRAENELLSADLSGKLDSFEVYFHTNSCNEATWQAAHQEMINECSAICAQYSGSFVAAHGQANCLFKLTLPGKLF